mmetsp:Transcript_9605/g.9909  ORF Transcript_9605/g.9909 Transcript_9605/m.9909 type:complete len:190 (+) Transcript_9605:6-575(+)
MSFFGLTSFGPESTVQSSLVNSNGFTLFSDEEYFKGFNLHLQELGTEAVKLQTTQVKHTKEILNKTFGFQPLDDEVELLKSYLNKENEEDLNWEELQVCLNRLRDDLNKEASISTKFNSYRKYYVERFKHIRNDHNPNETFKLPVSLGQTYGFCKFKERNLNNVRYPKVKCDETKYAEEIIKTGKQFMK